MIGTLTANEFKIDGNGIKFRGSINDANNIIAGAWYLQSENNEWQEFITIRLEK